MDFISIPNTDLRPGMTLRTSEGPLVLYSASISETAPLINGRPPVSISSGFGFTQEFLDSRGESHVEGYVIKIDLDDESTLLALRPKLSPVPGDEPETPEEFESGRWDRVPVYELVIGDVVFTEHGERTIRGIDSHCHATPKERKLSFTNGGHTTLPCDWILPILRQRKGVTPDPPTGQAPETPNETEEKGEPEVLQAEATWVAPSEAYIPLKPTAPEFTPRSFPVFPEVTAMRGGLSFSDPYAHLTREQLIERIRERAAEAAKAMRKVRKLKETRRRLRRIIEEGRS